MRLALIGAPGSGKTELAKELEKVIGGAVIVDDYVDDLGRDADLAMGDSATYIGNLYVVLGRIKLEREAAKGGANTITCGTLIESSIYTTIDTVRGQTPAHWVRCNNFMALLGNLREDTWNYDHVFVTTLDDPDPDSVEGQVDQALFMALSAFGLNFTPLHGTLEEKVAAAKEEIERTSLEPQNETPLRPGV